MNDTKKLSFKNIAYSGGSVSVVGMRMSDFFFCSNINIKINDD